MARPKSSVPTYRRHEPSNTARCWVGGKWVSLGRYNSPESRAAHARILAELAAAPASAALALSPGPGATVDEVVLAFWRHALTHYRLPDGTPTSEVAEFKQSLKVLRALYGPTPAAAFGPLGLKAVRQAMVEAGLARPTVNARVRRVKHAFKWAAAEELVPPGVYQALACVAGLQKGRTPAPEPDAVGPVADEHVAAVLPFLRSPVRGMVRVQLLTGMRPGDVVRLRPCDLDRSGPVWVYRPPHHKTAHRGKARAVAIGRRAQEVLAEHEPEDPAGHYFDPRRATAERNAERSAARKTPRYPSHQARNAAKRVAAPKRPPAGRYTGHSYVVAVTRGVERANARRAGLAGAGNFDPVPHWAPNQLRHAHGTEVRKRFGLEAAQVALGHERADTTEIYAQRNLALALRVAAEMG